LNISPKFIYFIVVLLFIYENLPAIIAETKLPINLYAFEEHFSYKHNFHLQYSFLTRYPYNVVYLSFFLSNKLYSIYIVSFSK